jgi:hypothetical protein
MLTKLTLLATLAGFLTVVQAQTTITLTVEGGEKAGTYEAKTEDTTCSYGLVGEDSWGNQYSIDTQDPDAFSSLQLIVPSTKAAETGTNAFLTTISFGPLFSLSGEGVSYEIDSRDPGSASGEGTVTIEDNGNTARVTITGTTAEGVGLEAAIECGNVMRAGG